MRRLSHRTWFLTTMALLIATAWVTLWLWRHSAYGRYLDHRDWTKAGYAASLCQTLPAGQWLLPIGIYLSGWLLMSTAMMLPTVLPLLDGFRQMVRDRRDRGRLTLIVIVGYGLVWLGFGVLAHGLDFLVHDIAQSSDWLTFHGWAIGAAVIALAGVFQFTSLKDFCLTRCRAPLGFIFRHWRGVATHRQALAIGLDHGLYCVGCCWALMLLMFVVGTASVGWMLLLGAIMAAEKNLPWGQKLAAPIGVALLLWAGVMSMSQLM